MLGVSRLRKHHLIQFSKQIIHAGCCDGCFDTIGCLDQLIIALQVYKGFDAA